MDKFPHVAIIGSITEDEINKLNERVGNLVTLFYYKTDTDIKLKIATYKLHVFVTVGKSDTEFKEMMQLSYYYRSKWLHYIDINQLQEYNLFSCFFTDQKNKEIPLVSVCTTSYKSGEKIMRPFHSLLKQIYTNWEWVIFDDSPKCHPNFELLTFLTTQDPRIRIYRASDNCAVIGDVKFNSCRLAHGEILVEVDHDDELTDDCLQMLVDAFKQFPDADFAFTDCAELYEGNCAPFKYCEGYCFGYGGYYRQKYQDKLLNVARSANINPKTIRNIIGVPNHVRAWKTSFYDKIGGHNYLLPVADDYELIVRTFLKGKMVKIPHLGYLQYRNKDGNTTFTRNDEITKLQAKSSWFYDAQITERMKECGIDDNYKNIPYKYIWESSHLEIEPYYNYTIYSDCVSVIIPTFQRPEMLRRAINSVLNQTYQNFEIIITADGCPQFESVVLEYNDSRIKWWNQERNYNNYGITPRNYALKLMTSGKYIAYLDDDDYWTKDHLESIMVLFRERNELSFVFSSFQVGEYPIICKKPVLHRIKTSTLAHKYDIVEKYGYWTRDENNPPELELVTRWKKNHATFASTKKVTVVCQINKGQPSASEIYTAHDDQPPKME